MTTPRRGVTPVVLAALAVVLSWASYPTFGADSPGYYSYLRSLFFDRDLSFANELEAWGGRQLPPTSTGLSPNPYSIGPAIVWSPFFALAHLYVITGRAVGLVTAAADGYSAPYLQSVYAGTLVVALAGAWLLWQVIAARLGRTWATLAVVTATAASPVLYYILVLPAMAHGLVFGAVGGLIWSADQVSNNNPSRRGWWLFGFLTGLVALLRWQAAVCGVLFLLLSLDALRRKRTPTRWLFEAASLGVATTTPQFIAWKVIYGTWLAVPQGSSFFDRSSSHMWDVLMHADRGLFIWTPVMAVALLGLALGHRRWGSLATAGLLVFGMTVWVNGSLFDWAGSDSFGSRRFDLVVPFFALGLASALQWQAQRPAVLPAVVATVAILWNLGLMGLYRDREITEAAPLERVAGFQSRRLRRTLEHAADQVGGPKLRALVYKAMVGEYFYWNVNRSGTIDLASPSERHLAGGWSEPRWEDNRAKFRWAFPPRACISVPLERPIDLRTTIRARAPGRLTEPQVATVELNGSAIRSFPLPEEWTDLEFVLPSASMVPGENLMCVAFAHTARTNDGRDVSAAVARIQFP